MGKKANNKSKKLPLKKKISPRPLSIHVDMPRIVARQDETYRPVRLTNEAINLGYEKLKGKATTPKLRTKISNAQENFNVRQGRHLLVVTRGYDTTRREKQQQKSEDAERGKQQRIREQFSSDTPYSVINNIESARRNQPLFWNKDIVDNAKNMLNIVNRDYLVIPGYLSMISAYNPYTQNLEIAQTFSDATRLHGYVNAAQMATAAGLAPLKFGLSLGAMYAGNKLGDKAVDLGMKWFTPYNSWYDYANKKWGYNEEEALRSNPGGWILGGLGMLLGPKIANTKPFIPLRLSYELSDPAYLLDVGYITTSEKNPAMFNIKTTSITGEPTLTKHLLGNEAIKMFKEYGGKPLPENSKIGELLRKYVPEARERYGIVNRPEITDEEIAQALYKLIISLDNLTMNPYYSTKEPLLGFRGDTLRYTELKPRPTPDELVKGGGTMDNSLGSLFLGELPEAEKGVGVDRYVVTLNPESSETSGLWQVNTEPSATGAGSVNIPKTISYTGEGYPPQFSEYSSYTLTPHFINDRGYFWAPKIKVKPQYTTSGVNDINGFMFKGKPRDASFEIEVGESGRAAEQKYGFKLHTAEKPVANPDDPEGVTLIWNGKELNLVDDAGVEHGAARELMAEHYTNLLNDALQNNLGVLVSAAIPISSSSAHPFRGEHGSYTYIALPNFNIKGAKHILPYDLRLPRNWNDPNIYKGAAVRKNRYIWNYDPNNPHHITLHLSSKVSPNFRVSNVTDTKAINNGLTPEAEAELAKRANWQGDSFLLAKDRLANGGYERLSSTALEVVDLGEGQLIYNNRTGEFIDLKPRNYYYAEEFLGRDLNDMLNAKPEYMSSSDLGNGLTGENIAVAQTDRDGKHIIVFNDRPYEYLISNLATSDLIGHEFEHYTHNPFEKLPEDVYRPLSAYYKRYGNTEVAARIGLIKAYYGLREGEPLTGDHFRYAEKHFVKDRGYDNGMTTFFKGIVDYDKLAEWANRNVLGIAVPLGIGLGISSLE